MTDINGTYSCCNTTNIFGEETEGGGGGLTPGQEQDLTDVVEKTQNQDATAGNTNFSGVLTLNGLPLGSGGGDVVGPATSADNGVCFYSGTSGKIIKEIATIKYNPVANVVAVPDLSTTLTTSLNSDLQRISNIVSAVQLPDPVTVLDGELDVKFIKSFEKNVELEFDDDEAILTATDITLNGAVASSGDIKVYDPTGANLDQSLLRKDRLQFSGIPADNALGLIRFDDGLSYKQIIMSVDKGNFVNQSRGVISVDGGTYQFGPNEFAMLNKRITLLSDPIGVLDAANKQYVDSSVEQVFIDPVIKTSVTLENDIAANTLVLTSSETTGFNLIESISGPLDLNSTDFTINLNAAFTENIGSNKLSIISGNMTESVASNKVLNVGGNNISSAALHQINGPINATTSINTPILNGITEINNGSNININNIGGDLIITNDNLVVNSFGGIDMTATNGGIQIGGGRLTTTNVAFTNPQEMVSKKYIDDLQPTIVKFDTTIDTILYEDNNIKISYLTADAQPSFELKIPPAGPGAFGSWVDTSISFIGGGSFSGNNGDATNAVGLKAFFYGSTAIDPNYNHINYGATSRCILCAETDLTYPTYELTLINGNIANLGVSKVEVY